MLEIPRIIDGRYRVDRLVGEGGFGAVYAGEHLVLGVPVAIKVSRRRRRRPSAAPAWCYHRRMDAEYEKRAAARRARMTGGVARSFAELDDASREFWANASFAEKLQATHEALAEAWTLKGRHGPPPRFDGSTWGVLKFER